MDVPELLEAASLLVPAEIATENDITINDVWDYLAHDEWEVALGLLEELGDVRPLPLDFWESLAAAAGQMRLEKSAAWCHWRCYESRTPVGRVHPRPGARRAFLGATCPLDPSQWRHLQPGQTTTMHEDRTIGGTAVVLEVQGPTATPAP
ncbi:hypothetical protein [Streptomyces sp. G-G2]|uniref:hypothetical protein n=1 Tax=Streptomyces sp. G-G2 TaxID=3046201 RepID=UPI0024BB5D2A|nr:hypothetical protein [Streptomyces sp. G-G2]MDJ0384535.1 hypothetical protein [Streptomyces sp. G-G2]